MEVEVKESVVRSCSDAHDVYYNLSGDIRGDGHNTVQGGGSVIVHNDTDCLDVA